VLLFIIIGIKVYQCQDLVMQTTVKYHDVNRLRPFRPDVRSVEALANTDHNLHEIELIQPKSFG
jgi:hypothetical protein